jgi:hypothetical protein
MGDRQGKNMRGGWRHPGLVSLRPPPEIIGWGLSRPAPIGHNQGPPLEPVGDAFVRYLWRKAHREAWKNPPLSIIKLRVARAEAAGVSYRAYMLELLDSGRHLQAADVAKGSATSPRPQADRQTTADERRPPQRRAAKPPAT